MIKDENKRIQITVSPDTLSLLDYVCELYSLSYSQAISLCIRIFEPSNVVIFKHCRLDPVWSVIPDDTPG